MDRDKKLARQRRYQMSEYNPFDAGDAQVGGARPIFNAGSTAGAPKQPEAEYDPFKMGDAAAASAQDENYTPFEKDAALSNEELRKQFEEEYAKSPLERAKELPGHVWQGIKGFVEPIIKGAPEEMGHASTEQGFGKRMLSTFTSSKARALQELADFAIGIPAHQVEKFVDSPGRSLLDLVTGPLPLDYLEKKIRPEAAKERAWRDYQKKYFRNREVAKQGEEAPGGVSRFATTVVEPFSNIAEQIAGPGKVLPTTEHALSTIEQIAIPEAAAGLSAKLAKVTGEVGKIAQAEKLAAGAGKVAQVAGRTAEVVGELPKTLVTKAAEAALGPETAAAVNKAANIAGLGSLPTALIPGPGGIVGKLKALSKVGTGVRGAGEITEALAKAPPNSIWGRMHSVATSEGAPNWMKTLLSSEAAKVVGDVARTGADVAKGAATGAAIGGIYGAGTGQSPEEIAESMGGGGAMGAGVHLAKLPGSRNRQILQRTAAASAELLKQHLADGVSPEALKSVPDSAWSMAAALEQHSGINAKVRFVSPETFAGLKTPDGSPLTDPGAGGVWDRSRRTIWLNVASKRGVVDTLLHEMAHPIFDNAVLRQPEIARTIDAALAEKGQTIDNMKRTYIESLMRNELAAMPDHQTREAAILNRLSAYDAAFPNNAWVYSEALAENYVNSLQSKDVLHLDPTVAGIVRSAMKEAFGAKENAQGFFKEFDNVVQSPELSKLSRGLLRSAKEHRPGLDILGGEEASVTLTPEMFGKRAEAPLHDLPNGERGNDFVVASPDGIKKRAPSAIRKILRDRVAAVRGLFDKSKVKGLGDADPEVGYRRTKAGGEEISGKVLPPSFDNLSVYSNDTKNIAKAIQEAIKTGDTLGSWYHQVGTSAGTKSWAQSVRQGLGAFTAKYHDYQPFGWLVDKQGNLSAYVFDRQALSAKLADWANRKGITSLEQWGGDQGKAMADIQTYLDNHLQGLPGEANGIGPDKANTINALLTGKTGANPLAEHLKGKDRQGIVRSLRLDRIETLEPSQQKPMPRPDYSKLAQNFSPTDEMDTLFHSKPEDYNRFVSAFTGPYGGGQTGWSFELGSRIKTVAEANHLRELAAESSAKSKEARAANDLSSAFHWAYKAQAFREAFEAATDEKLSGGPSTTREFINKNFGVDFKTPLPESERSPEATATEVMHQAGMEHRSTQLFSPSEREKAKPEAVGGKLKVLHFSDAGDKLTTIDPAKMRVETVGKYWEPKPERSFFFIKGSELSDRNTKFTGRTAYEGVVDGKKIYDATGEDPLGFFETWPIAREKPIIEAGYDGVLISANGGKDKILISYKPVEVKPAKPGSFSPDVAELPKAGKPAEEPASTQIDLQKAARFATRIPAILKEKQKAGQASPGVTFNVSKGKETKQGFAVSLWPDLSRNVAPEELTHNTLSDFIKTNWDLLHSDPNMAVGIWDDRAGSTGKLWLDIVTTSGDKAFAEYAGRKYNQAGIGNLSEYSAGRDGFVSTGGTGEIPGGVDLSAGRLGATKSEFEASKNEPVIQGTITQARPEETVRDRPRQPEEYNKLDYQHVINEPDMQKFADATVDHFKTLPGFMDIDSKDTHAALAEITRRMEANLETIFARSTEAERAMWKQWYDYAHTMSKEWGNDFGVPWQIVAAINAKFSPQTPWFDNVTLTRATLQTLKDNPRITEAEKSYLIASLKKAGEDNKKLVPVMEEIKPGTLLSDMPDVEAGAFIRVHNEIQGMMPTHDHAMEPIGGGTGWNCDYPDLAKIVSIYRDQSRKNVNEKLGRNHKVRSFYNNHIDPSSPLWTTIDTHAMCAALLLPLGSTDAAIKKGFGGIAHKASGYKGAYWLYQHAYEQVAKKVGVLPRELQSIVWEKIRQFLSPEGKRALQDAAEPVHGNKVPPSILEIHKAVSKGKLTPEEGRDAVLRIFEEARDRNKEEPGNPDPDIEPF